MSDARDPLPPGTLFGAYRVEQRLGAGGVGAVYRATHTGLQKPVVLKVLHPQYAQVPVLRARFAREGRAAAAIRHPHIVDVTDVGEHQGTPYLIMELLEGESLSALIERSGVLSPDLAVDLMLPVIAAVDAAHEAGVVHRDLKPDNLFVTRGAAGEPFPKVLDFGISRVVAGDGEHRTATATMLGTPAYMAPEQIESTRDADARSDQYALGVILYECLTGTDAFEGDNVYAILKRVGDGNFKPPRALRPELSPALEAIVLRAMSKRPAERFPSLRMMAAALLPFASDRSRISWSPSFWAEAELLLTDTLNVSRSAPPRASITSSDTSLGATRPQASIAPPVTPDKRRNPWITGAALVGVAIFTAVVLTSEKREARTARHAATDVSTRTTGSLVAEQVPAAPIAPPDAAVMPMPVAPPTLTSPTAAPPTVVAPPPRQARGGRAHVRAHPSENGATPAQPAFPDLPP
ncbi:MAG: serine/threonine-protein kinase [Polyangiales bacterium]